MDDSLDNDRAPLLSVIVTGRAHKPVVDTRSSCTAAQGWPEQFLKGVAISVWQNSSDRTSNWTRFAALKNYFGQRHLVEAFQQSCDFWNRYQEDIALVKAVGATSFRFSLEWARLQPLGPKQALDPDAVQMYHRMLDCMQHHGLTPMATLHHFTHPTWFEDLGGFEQSANAAHFVDYSRRVYEAFGSRITLWSTFNEPTCYAAVGYIFGLWAPGKKLRFRLAGQVLANMLSAHCAAYRALKAQPGGQAALVGMVHQHLSFHPAQDMFYIRWLSQWMTRWFATQSVLDFFTTGTFTWQVPLWGHSLSYTDLGAPACVDWWGINYYSRPYISWRFQLVAKPNSHELLSDTRFRLYPKGLYRTIQDASCLGVPMFITETGLADGEDKLRAFFIGSHYQQVLRALNDGYDVRGIYYWTLMDNIEWHQGFDVKFGLYAWCPIKQRHAELPLALRPGSKALVKVHEAWPDGLEELRRYSQQPEHQRDVC